MFNTARVVTDSVKEKLPADQQSLVWEMLEFRRDTIQDPERLQAFWLGDCEIWVYNDGRVTTMFLPGEILQEA